MDTSDTTTSATPTDELSHRRRVAELATDIADLCHDVVDRAKEYSQLGVPAAEWLELVADQMPPKVGSVLRYGGKYAATAIDIVLAMQAGKSAEDTFDEVLRREIKPALAHRSEPEVVDVSMTRARAMAQEILQTHDGEHELTNLAHAFLAHDGNSLTYNEATATIRMRDIITRLFAECPKLETPGKGEDADQTPAMEVHILLRGAPMQFSGILSTTPEGTLKLLTPVPGAGGQAPVMIEQFFDYADVTSVALVRDVKATASSRIITTS